MDERCNIKRKLDEYTERLKISTRDWREILPRPIAEELFKHFDNYWWDKYFDLLTAFLKHTRGADKRKKYRLRELNVTICRALRVTNSN